MRAGRLPLQATGLARLTYHDSCYLGRHNGHHQEPRDILASLALGNSPNSRTIASIASAAAAGGGLMWTEEKLGQRINHLADRGGPRLRGRGRGNFLSVLPEYA